MTELDLRAKEIFISALDEAPETRSRFIDDRCGDDATLREEVEALMAAFEGSETFLETPALQTSRSERRDDGDWIGRKVGQFTIQSVLASGGMGVVYLADQQQPRRTVALKMMRAAFPTTSAIRRFEYEAEVLGRLRHPNIAQIYEAGVYKDGHAGVNGTPYFALEFIEGSLDIVEYCREKELGLNARLELFVHVCRAVHYAHQQGVIHRDLKPHNILVELTHGAPKIIDFGIARAAEREPTLTQTAEGQVMGTLLYASPEQCSGDRDGIDTRADVYSLGALLYEVLAGCTPFQLGGKSIPDALQIIKNDEPKRLGTIDPRLRGDVETIVQKAMDKDRDRRYQSAQALADDILRYLQHEPIAARPPSTMYQLKKFSQRNRALVSGLAASFLILFVGIISVSVALASENKQRKRAEEATTTANFQRQQAVDARDAEAAERRRANELAAAAREQAEMTARLLNSVSPWVSGTETTDAMLQALEESVAALEEGWEGPPLNEAAIRLAAARSFRGLGRVTEARENGERALEIFLEHLGEHHEYTVRTLVHLSAVADDQGRFDDARALLVRAAEAVEQTPGVDPGLHVSILNSQCRSAIRVGHHAEAEGYARRAVELSQHPSVTHPTRNTSKLALADSLSQQQRHAEAEPLYLEVLEDRIETLGDEHPSTLVTQHNLAGLLIRSGRADEALPHLEHVLRTRREVLGDGHSMTLIAMNDLASTNLALSELDRARTIAEEGLALHIKHLGSTHPYTVTIRNTLAHAFLRLSEFDRCAELLHESLAIAEAQQGPDGNTVLLLKHNLGVLYKRMNRTEEGVVLLRESVEGRARLYGPNDAQTRSTKQQYSESLVEFGEIAEARAVVDDLLANEADANDFPWIPGMTRGVDAACMAAEGDLDGAAARFREAITMLGSVVGVNDFRAQHVVQAAMRFAQHYDRPVDEARFREFLN